jgi:hypothetical protein
MTELIETFAKYNTILLEELEHKNKLHHTQREVCSKLIDEFKEMDRAMKAKREEIGSAKQLMEKYKKEYDEFRDNIVQNERKLVQLQELYNGTVKFYKETLKETSDTFDPLPITLQIPPISRPPQEASKEASKEAIKEEEEEEVLIVETEHEKGKDGGTKSVLLCTVEESDSSEDSDSESEHDKTTTTTTTTTTKRLHPGTALSPSKKQEMDGSDNSSMESIYANLEDCRYAEETPSPEMRKRVLEMKITSVNELKYTTEQVDNKGLLKVCLSDELTSRFLERILLVIQFNVPRNVKPFRYYFGNIKASSFDYYSIYLKCNVKKTKTRTNCALCSCPIECGSYYACGTYRDEHSRRHDCASHCYHDICGSYIRNQMKTNVKGSLQWKQKNFQCLGMILGGCSYVADN